MSETRKVYHCPCCNGSFPEDEMAAYRDKGEWKVMCPECLDWTELKPIQSEGWYLDASAGSEYLGTTEEVLRRLIAGESLGVVRRDRDSPDVEVTMRSILEYEMTENYVAPPRFKDVYDDFDWGKAWLDGRLTGYSPADYLTEILNDEDTKEVGTLWNRLIYIGVAR